MAKSHAHLSLVVLMLAAASIPVTARGSDSSADGPAEPVDQADPGPQQNVDSSQNPGSPQSSSSPDSQHPNPLRDSRDRVYYPGDSEQLKPLMRKLAGNILLDQKDIWTSPFRMNAQDAPWWIGFTGATAALIATDHQTSTLLENSKGQVAWGNNISNIGASYTLIPLVAGFYGFGVIRDDPKAREVGVLGTEALLDSLIVSSVLKPIAGRNRPDSLQEKGQFFDGGSSFPSGHAIEAWSLASVISYEYGHTKFVPIVACSLAALVSTARFTAQRHFASDIVAGGGMGWFIGRYVWKTHQDHAIHPHGLHAQVIPELEPASRTYAVGVTLTK
ncbi:MAG TPA: phosphatase PAP2 family protein [Bryobacteraceae bacterium]|nr:phosphatase PAP2 family protein [Bryobacteraceae bacterium]